MRVIDRADAVPSQVGAVEVSRWEQYGLDGLPFGAMWYSVPPASHSRPDRHPEVELSLVLSGAATVHVDGEVREVAAGAAFLLSADTEHVVHNRSVTEPLVVFSAYWLPTPGATR